MLFEYSLTNKSQKLFTIISLLYFLILGVEAFAIYTKVDTLELIVRPLMLFVLMFYYIKSAKQIKAWFVVVFVIILITDVLNIYNEDELFFFYELITTTIYFSFYLVYFFKKIIKKTSILKIVINFLIFSSCIAVLFFIATPKLDGDLFILALLNTIVTMLVCTITFMTLLMKNTKRNFWFFISFFAIVVANAILSIYKFVEFVIILKILEVLLYAIFNYIICVLMVGEVSEEKV